MSVLITGGAGYIGSITVDRLRRNGEQVVILDNLSRGHRSAVPEDVPFYEGNVGDKPLVSSIVRKHQVDACVHFAAFAYVGESVEQPALYFENNITQGVALLDALVQNGVRQFVFSSTCAVYGEPEVVPISEDAPQSPMNPYGWSKFFIEKALESFAPAYGLRFVALRYFNAAGAVPHLGEDHDPETHLIPRVLSVASGDMSELEIYGTDYPTKDGTAIRDYIHVLDLAVAHELALAHLRAGKSSAFLNVGTGQGYSVREIVETAERITGKTITCLEKPRRAGDPPELVARPDKARNLLGWKAEQSNLEDILESAWQWHLNLQRNRKSVV